MHACCCIVEKNRIRFFFWILDEKKAYQHWYFFSLKDYSEVFSPLIIVTRRNIRRIRLACLAMVKKVSKKKPFCSKVCLCIQTFSTWYCRKKFQSVDHYCTWGKSPQRCWHLKTLNLQQLLELMSKIEENDGYWCFTRMLNFCSKTFRMLELTLSTDLLLGHC